MAYRWVLRGKSVRMTARYLVSKFLEIGKLFFSSSSYDVSQNTLVHKVVHLKTQTA